MAELKIGGIAAEQGLTRLAGSVPLPHEEPEPEPEPEPADDSGEAA